jgi:hypothetical protein
MQMFRTSPFPSPPSSPFPSPSLLSSRSGAVRPLPALLRRRPVLRWVRVPPLCSCSVGLALGRSSSRFWLHSSLQLYAGRWLLDLRVGIWRRLVGFLIVAALPRSEPEATRRSTTGASVNKRPLSSRSVEGNQGMTSSFSVHGVLEADDRKTSCCWAADLN